ncbi:sensory rhodopsin transducer [Salinimicrobium oceani]|uniref:Sensory rhodopsin transducer n=1 Tax=Salinimicrobium oceani TaxID=2722702 RepID=A0ABX1CYE5_9FLAO|nr:sensory rhodopsin transducer [Salinimicrobium oceani]NJW53283.1 hypothetical protein [Salinimicrobium oceani]
MNRIGKLNWAFAGGHIPFASTGEEPMFNSHDKIAILNTAEEEAEIEIFIFYENSAPVGSYSLKVKAQRLRKVRFNDLIDPEAIQLERKFSCYLRSSLPVVVQFSRMDTGQAANAVMGTIAFPAD